MAATQHKFFELIRTGTKFEFIAKSRVFVGLSIVAMVACVVMMILNAWVIPGRGRVLNWGVDFRGGTEIEVEFSRAVDAAAVRKALDDGGYPGAEVVRYGASSGDKSYMIRLGAVSIVSEEQAKKAQTSMAKVGDAALKKFEWSEGGDKLYVRFDKALESTAVKQGLKDAGIGTTQVQPFGRMEDHTFEATLVSLDTEVKRALEKSLGAGVVDKIPQAVSVGAKAGRQLQIDGIKSLVGAMLLITLYVALRFDFRYGPGAILALLHDAFFTLGVFALTYREFSLTTLAAVLTIIGFSVNDTIVVFDRIRENVTRLRDRPFDRVVNQSINETLSRTILTSATLFLVTLAMNILGTGMVRDFAFAMNVGIVVGTYSSIFIASPLVIWLNDRVVKAQNKVPADKAARRERHRASTQPV